MEKGGAQRFFEEIRGRRVAICGIGVNNTPVVKQFLNAGALVTACDRRTREQLGETAVELEAAGAVLQLGEGYLDSLDADLILRTPGMKPYLPAFEKARAQGVTVTSEMELFFALCPAPIYAVTGSDGKTTTTTILARLLERSGRRVWLGGNIGRALLPFIHEVNAEDAAVVELSSFQLTGMTQSPHVAVVTNVSPNHLDWHTDMQEYVDAKRNLVRWQQSSDRAVLNGDDATTCSYAEGLIASCGFFSRRQKPQNGAYLRSDGMLCAVNNGEETPVVAAADIRIPGVHNVENYLAAIAALHCEVTPQTIADFAREFGGVEHRSEWVRTINGVRWYNDSIGSSPSRTIAGLRAFDRKVILIAGGYDKNIPYTPLGEAAPDTVKTAILLGATAGAIETAIRTHSADLPIHRVANMEEAVRTAHALAQEGDIVFLSPASASFDMYKNFEERGQHFKRLVQALKEE